MAEMLTVKKRGFSQVGWGMVKVLICLLAYGAVWAVVSYGESNKVITGVAATKIMMVITFVCFWVSLIIIFVKPAQTVQLTTKN